MPNILSRLERLERSSPDTKKQHRVIRLVASDEEEAEAERLLEAEGFDPASGDIAIIRLICGPGGSDGERYNKPAYILSDTGNVN
ncbi:hypothetical protein [Aminobacter niigataensis]|uniref:hypothetical protein n=1 Tax=Aminobacter niigataensis TaxID=83265 RepID=UPI0024CCCA04|nr:hypothetical protein [Aminobacter niigataensis]CAI2932452.1 DNA topoisomerase II [Aminobacter niigataensis]